MSRGNGTAATLVPPISAGDGQTDLFASPLEPQTIQERFEAWLATNPQVYQLIRRFAYEALHAGLRRFGISPIIERVRWHMDVESRDPQAPELRDSFKINNNYRSRIVRRLIAEDARFADLFETRELRSP